MTSGKVAIVSGAGKGIGAAIARALHDDGYRLVLFSPSGSAARLAGELDQTGLTGSTTNAEDIGRIVAHTLDQFGRIDAVVNNMSSPGRGDLLEITDQDWEAGLETCLLSVIRMCRAVTPVMQRQGAGAIVNVSSYMAVEPKLAYPISSVIRGGLSNFACLYADRYGPEGIRMNNILPGYMENVEFADEIIAGIPLRRRGGMREIAETAAFLLSDGAGYLTGQNIRVEGGVARSP